MAPTPDLPHSPPDSTASPISDSDSENILDHRRLRQLLAQLAVAFGHVSADGVSADRGSRLLVELQAYLQGHFAAEEASGQFADVSRNRPEMTPKIEALIAEHRTLLATADRLVADMALVSANVSVFIAALSAHEEAERDLLHDLLFTDLGVGD